MATAKWRRAPDDAGRTPAGKFMVSARPMVSLDAETLALRESLVASPDIHLFWNPGNLGDGLIRAGARRLLKDLPMREVRILRDFQRGEVQAFRGHTALIIGSGNWCRVWHEPLPRLLGEIEPNFERTIILPSTFEIEETSVRQALARTKAKVYARERVSYEAIRHLCDAALTHDFAFHFDYAPFAAATPSGSLNCYREDPDSARPWPEDNVDISRRCFELDQWLWTIAQHQTLRTDRAHVAIAAACMGRTVHYRSSGYFKLPAMVDYSLAGFANVHRDD